MYNNPNSGVFILDTALNTLKNMGPFADEVSPKDCRHALAPFVLVKAWDQLERDGFVYSTRKVKDNGDSDVRYFISINGLLALENCPIWFRNRPYKWKAAKEKLGFYWKIACIIAVLINAIVVLAFTYLTYIKE